MNRSTVEIKSIDQLTQICDQSIKETGSLQAAYNDNAFTIQFDYKPYVIFSDENYRRNLMCSSEHVDIYVLCWKKDQETPIHDHPEKGCIMYLLDGTLEESIYSNDGTNTIKYELSKILKGECTSYNYGTKLLHKILALEDSISLHIYHKNYIVKYYE